MSYLICAVQTDLVCYWVYPVSPDMRNGIGRHQVKFVGRGEAAVTYPLLIWSDEAVRRVRILIHSTGGKFEHTNV